MENEDNKEMQNQKAAPEVETPKTDNLTDKTDNPKTDAKTDKKKSMFGKKDGDKSKVKELEAKIEELNIEKAELNDKFLRLYSEFENYRKRVTQEKIDLINTASEKVIVNLLPVIDDYERAIAANEKVDDINSIKDGFTLIYNKLLQLLKRFDVKEIDAIGKDFDTDFHEAVTRFPAQKEEDKGKVIDVTEKGYMLKDKVIRFSKVVVAQ